MREKKNKTNRADAILVVSKMMKKIIAAYEEKYKIEFKQEKLEHMTVIFDDGVLFLSQKNGELQVKISLCEPIYIQEKMFSKFKVDDLTQITN